MTTANLAARRNAPSQPPASGSAPDAARGRHWRAFRAMFASELRLMLREPSIVVWAAVLPPIAMIVLSVLPATREPVEGLGGSFAEVYLPVLILFAITMLALQTQPMTLAMYREIGVLKRLRTTPASPWLLLGATGALNVVVSLVACAVLVAIPAVAGIGLPDNLFGFALVVVLATLSLVGIGNLVAAIVPNSRVTGGIGWVLGAITWFSAGMWMPRALFPDWLAVLTDVLPGGAAAGALLETANGGWPNLWQVLVLVAWTALTYLVAVRAFRFE